jgi:uncharacterized protein (TIGR02246 family)
MRALFQFLAFTCIALLCLIPGVAARAEDVPKNDAESAVRSAARNYADAVARGDVERLLESWTKDGDYIDAAGRRHLAREYIRKWAAKPRVNARGARVDGQKSSLRIIATGVAVEDGTYESGISGAGDAETGRFTAVWVKRDGKWLLDSLRESVAQASPMSERLKPLEWLLGEWIGVADDSVFLISARVSDRGNYIIREFAILGEGVEATATERIGWDPANRQFKSWTFDSQDGRGEGAWEREGDGWLVETKEVMADGSEALTTASVTPSDGEHFLWNVTRSKVGDQSLPLRRIKFKRAVED